MIKKEELFEKYLDLLGASTTKPDFNLLTKIVRAHLNISKLLYKKQGITNIPDMSAFLNGIEKYSFGGTCYTNN